MERYTIEDIELIRRKSGISYQEAVALLDYHNGNVARALVDLERNGRIKPEGAQRASEKSQARKTGFSNLMTRLYQCRLKIKKGNITIANLSLLFSVVALIISPHLVILGIILCLILGYHITFVTRVADFAAENLERMVKNAAQNVKSSVGDIARGFPTPSIPTIKCKSPMPLPRKRLSPTSRSAAFINPTRPLPPPRWTILDAHRYCRFPYRWKARMAKWNTLRIRMATVTQPLNNALLSP